jgi:ATP-binding cassette subfamily B protein
LPLLVVVPGAVVLNSFALPYIAARIIDRLSQGSVPLSDVWSVFGADIVAFVCVVVIGEVVLWRVAIWLIWSMEARVVKRLYEDAFDHLSKQSSTFFADRFVGSMVSAVNKFTGAYILAADTVVFMLLPLVTAVVVPVVVIGPEIPLFAVGVLIVILVFVLIAVFSYRPVARLTAAEAEKHTEIGGRLADVLSNSLVVKSYAREDEEEAGFTDFTRRHRFATLDVLRSVTGRDIGLGVGLSMLMAVTLASILVGQASGLGVGMLIVVLTFSLALFGWLWEIPQIARMYNRVYGDAMPMMDLFEVQPAVVDPERPEFCRISSGAISVDRVTFAYPDATRPVFTDLTLDIAPSERVGLVGPSGSGKTSITRLILRFFDPQSGAVRIDGQDVRDVAQADLRSRIAFVPQEPLLFHRSIAENIRYGRRDATPEEVLLAAERAQVMEFVRFLDDGMDTVVGERGVKLSGGQRQRIAIARAILSDAPILVLDEATSALDSLSEARIQQALEEAMAGRTTIAIAHRLSTLRSMTRLVILDHGRVVEDGPHDVLLDRGGVYADMWEQQSGGFVEV